MTSIPPAAVTPAGRRRWMEAGAVVAYLAVFGWPGDTGSAAELAAALASSALIAAGMLARWRWPVPALLALVALTGLRFVAGWSTDPCLAVGWVLYAAVLTRGRFARSSLWAALAASAVLVLATGTIGYSAWQLPLARFVHVGLLVCSTAWALGLVVRDRRAQAEASAVAVAEAAAAEERLRIAREMHDVLSHTLGAIGVQAGVARHLRDADPDRLRETLGRIEVTSRRAMDDLRVMLGTLREQPPLRPQPCLADLEALAGTAREAGVDCEVSIDVPSDLGRGVQLSAYRIAQEAVTNVVRHAAGSRCRVRVGGDGAAVEVEVVDDGPGAGPAGYTEGHGLLGMRERVLAHGGSLRVGDRAGGGFGVHAVLPLTGGEGRDG